MATQLLIPGYPGGRTYPVVSLPSTARRIPSVDLLRGLVMILMVLDHVRDYFTDLRFDPLDLTQTTLPLFFTRWVTQYCAPIVVLLAGISAWMASRQRSRPALARLLVTRGLWLVFLEVTVVSFGWYFNLKYEHGAILQVIWAIGVSMLVLAGLVFLPRGVIGAVAMLLIAGHNLLDGVLGLGGGDLWLALHLPGAMTWMPALVVYPSCRGSG